MHIKNTATNQAHAEAAPWINPETGKPWGRLAGLSRSSFLVRQAALRFETSIPQLVWRAASLYLRGGFRPQESAQCGLLDPRVRVDAEAGFVSRARLLRYQHKHNPAQWTCLTEDKAIFYPFCSAVGLAVAPLTAIFDPTNGWTPNSELLRTRQEWERFFAERLPKEFVVKPVNGVYGRGLDVYRREGNGFRSISSAGELLTPSSLYERLSSTRFRRFVIQPRIYNHPEVRRFTGTDALQTARIVTWVTKSGNVEHYLTMFKIIVGDSVIDNFNYGRTGNLSVNVCLEDGTLGTATGAAPDGIAFAVVSEHPTTGFPITGFRLPHWHAAVELVSRAALRFLPLRTIGWDIALTAEGPLLIEGNAWWDPFNLVVGPDVDDNDRGGMAKLQKQLESD